MKKPAKKPALNGDLSEYFQAYGPSSRVYVSPVYKSHKFVRSIEEVTYQTSSWCCWCGVNRVELDLAGEKADCPAMSEAIRIKALLDAQ